MSNYLLQEPSEVTKKRMLEIKFYLFMQSFLMKAGNQSTFKTDVLGIIANTFNLNTSALLSILNTLEHPQYKPTQKEIVIASKHMNMIVRLVTEQKLVSNGNYYRILQDYIDEGEPSLFPKLTEAMHEQIKLFFDNTTELFKHVSYVVRGEIDLWLQQI